MKQTLEQVLGNTLIADQALLKEASNFLVEASKQPNFCTAMMQIADDANNKIQIRQAALIQFKNVTKIRWNAKKVEIDQGEKATIRNALILAFIRSSSSPILIKLYKEIFTIIVSHEYKTWLPLNQLIQKIRKDEDVIPCIHILIAIATSFEFCINQEERSYFFEVLKRSLPQLNTLLQRNQTAQVIYLCIKFLWKSIHYQIDQPIRILTLEWMGLLHTVICSSYPQFDAKPSQFQKKGTPQFFYFHSKKWATRILLRFIQKHAKPQIYNKTQKNKQFSDKWYQTYGEAFITGLITQFSIGTVKKVRYFQLKCLQALIMERPSQLQQYAKPFQYDILLHYMRLQRQDQELANTDPIQFLNKEDQPSINFTNLKRVATDVWISFAQLGSKIQKKGQSYQPGIFFFENMNYLRNQLQSQNMIEKQLSMYIICQLRSTISKCKQVKAILPDLISKYVIPQFQNEVMFLRARAVDIFREYGMIEFTTVVITQSVEGIYTCLIKDTQPLVRIKAASAFNCILKHKSAKDLVRPLLKDILTVYLQLLEKYDLQSIVNCLESIVQDFSEEIAPFAYELAKHLSRLFIKLFNKDMEQSNRDEYDGQAELAAAGCLKTITQIIQSPITKETVAALQPEVIALLQFIYTSDAMEYAQDSLILLNAYLFKIQKISPHIWFYYQVVVYNVVGIPKPMWAAIDNLPITDKQKVILNSIKSGDNIEMMQNSMPVIRNFIRKGSSIIIENSDAFKTNLLHLLFYLINEIYKRGPTDYSGDIQMTCCTALLIYLLESYQGTLSQVIYQHIFEICKVNMLNIKSKVLKTLNSQLMGLLVWAAPAKTMALVTSANLLTTFLKELLGYQSRYEEEHQRQRLILGLNKLLLLPQKPTELLQKSPQIFKLLIKIVKKNALDRLDENDGPVGEQPQEEQAEEDFQNMEFDSEQDEDDFWEEMFNDNYSSPLDQIDQIKQFRNCIQKLGQEQPDIYHGLISIVSTEQLAILDDKINRAIEKTEKGA